MVYFILLLTVGRSVWISRFKKEPISDVVLVTEIICGALELTSTSVSVAPMVPVKIISKMVVEAEDVCSDGSHEVSSGIEVEIGVSCGRDEGVGMFFFSSSSTGILVGMVSDYVKSTS